LVVEATDSNTRKTGRSPCSAPGESAALQRERERVKLEEARLWRGTLLKRKSKRLNKHETNIERKDAWSEMRKRISEPT
jgi:hypothetical protein